MKKDTVVIHSGGMDSSICLALAVKEFGVENVLSLSFRYNQRHQNELVQAAKICGEWGVDHTVLNIDCLKEITQNSLTNHSIPIQHELDKSPSSLVVGRNGLMARLGAIHADNLGAQSVFMGVIEVEAWNSGYRDCTRAYMSKMEEILRIDLDNPIFQIRTPLVSMTKAQTLEVAEKLGVLEYLLKETITCYRGIAGKGCEKCPACVLRNVGVEEFEQQRQKFKS